MKKQKIYELIGRAFINISIYALIEILFIKGSIYVLFNCITTIK